MIAPPLSPRVQPDSPSRCGVLHYFMCLLVFSIFLLALNTLPKLHALQVSNGLRYMRWSYSAPQNEEPPVQYVVVEPRQLLPPHTPGWGCDDCAGNNHSSLCTCVTREHQSAQNGSGTASFDPLPLRVNTYFSRSILSIMMIAYRGTEVESIGRDVINTLLDSVRKPSSALQAFQAKEDFELLKPEDPNPGIPNMGDVFCSKAAALQLDDPDGAAKVCTALGLLSRFIICAASQCKPKASPQSVAPASSQYQKEGLNFEDYQKPHFKDLHLRLGQKRSDLEEMATPEKFLDPLNLKGEMGAYYWMWKALKLLTHTSKVAEAMQSWKPTSLPFWEPRLVIESYEQERNITSPLLQIATRKQLGETDYLVTIRGTRLATEWGIGFMTDPLIMPNVTLKIGGKLVQFPVAVHRGYASFGNILAFHVQTFLRQEAHRTRIGRVTLTGHSMGAALAEVIGFHLQQHAAVILDRKQEITSPWIQIVTFGGPQTGSTGFAQYLSHYTVVRHIESALDPVSRIPCAAFPQCPGTRTTPILTSHFKVISRLNADSLFTYVHPNGRVVIELSHLPKQWSTVAAGFNTRGWHRYIKEAQKAVVAGQNQEYCSCLLRFALLLMFQQILSMLGISSGRGVQRRGRVCFKGLVP